MNSDNVEMFYNQRHIDTQLQTKVRYQFVIKMYISDKAEWSVGHLCPYLNELFYNWYN